MSINTGRIAIQVYRVADRNLTSITGPNGDFLKQLSGYDTSQIANERGAKIYEGELEVTPKLNAEVTTAVPIGEAIPELKPGVYALVARAADRRSSSGDDDDSSGRTATQWFIVSDLGLAAFTGDNGLHAFVRSLTSTEPINNANVRIVARNNEVLAQGRTDGAGAWAQHDLPPGAYRVEVWHPRLREPVERIEERLTLDAQSARRLEIRLTKPLRPETLGRKPRSWSDY